MEDHSLPRGTGPHQYLITIYALKDARLDLKPDATLADFQNAIRERRSGRLRSPVFLSSRNGGLPNAALRPSFDNGYFGR